MADPVSASVIFGGMALLGGVFSAIGGIEAGYDQAEMYRQREKAYQYQAMMKEKQAKSLEANTNIKANIQEQQAEQFISSQRALALQNMGGLQGTAGKLIDQSAANATLERLGIFYEGEQRASGLREQAKLDRYAASMAHSQISPSIWSGYMRGIGGALGGATNYARLRYGRKGIF